MLARAFELAQAAGWSSRSLDGVVAGLRAVLGDQPDGRQIQPIRLSQIRATTGASRGPRVARMGQILDELGLLDDDTVPTTRTWIDHTCKQLPDGYCNEVRGVVADATPSLTGAGGANVERGIAPSCPDGC